MERKEMIKEVRFRDKSGKFINENAIDYMNKLHQNSDNKFTSINEMLNFESDTANTIPFPESLFGGVEIRCEVMDEHRCYGHESFLYFRNGYHQDDMFLPIVICESPYIPIVDYKLNIFNKDYEDICTFIMENIDLLEACKREEIDEYDIWTEYYKRNYVLNEAKGPVNQILTTKPSGIPYKLYIDTGKTFERGKHWKRVKFEWPKNNKNPHTWPSITMPGLQLVNEHGYKIPNKVVNCVIDFINQHYNDIDAVLSQEMSYDEFLNKLTTPVSETLPFVKTGKLSGDFEMVRDCDNKWNYINTNDELVYDKWFDWLSPFKNNVAKAAIGGDIYWLKKDGNIIKQPEVNFDI